MTLEDLKVFFFLIQLILNSTIMNKPQKPSYHLNPDGTQNITGEPPISWDSK